MSIVVKIHGQSFDVTEYVSQHPGEGVNDMFLEDYHGEDVTELFEYYHSEFRAGGKALYLLEKCKAKGVFSGIKLLEKP